MPKTGRNEPCPCGSGKKYKRCCLRKEAEQRNRERLEAEAPTRALAWLQDRFGDDMQGVFRTGFLESLEDNELDLLDELPDDLWQMIEINGWEFVLAEGKLVIDGDFVGCLDLVLGPSGPLLDASQRTYLEKLREQPLGLYEIVELQRGTGFELRDMLDEEQPVRWVAERAGSRGLDVGSVIATRPIPGSPWTLSGAIYPYPEVGVPELLRKLRGALARSSGEAPEPSLDRELRSSILVGKWLDLFLRPPSAIVDVSSGEASLMINDHYRVTDWDALVAALDTQPDVDGDLDRGWARLEDPGAEVSSILLGINRRGDDRIEAFGRTLTMADEGRAWLEEVTGDAISWITREIVDPMRMLDHPGDNPPPPQPQLDPSDLPEDFYQQLYQRIYSNWADEPIPTLGERTPRQALATPEGKRQVVDLLESYERGEQQKARQEGRDAADFDFLWREIGLSSRSRD